MLMGVVKRNDRVDAPHPAGVIALLGDGIINRLLAVDAWCMGWEGIQRILFDDERIGKRHRALKTVPWAGWGESSEIV